MATKKTAKKVEKKEEKASKREYFYAIGRRKSAIAKVKLYKEDIAQNVLTVNDRKMEEYFPVERLQDALKAPLALAGEGSKFNIVITVSGGGVNAQSEAAKLGIARALVVFNKELKKSLKSEKHLTRDPREVERKKFGLKKARRAPQWAKR